MYYKIHYRRKLYSTLCHCEAKSALLLNSINTVNSTSVEKNSKTLAQNKFNTHQPIQNLTGSLSNSGPNQITFTRVVSRDVPNFFSLFVSIRLYLSPYVSLFCLFVSFCLYSSLFVSIRLSERTYI